jgi:hypothetical protein
VLTGVTVPEIVFTTNAVLPVMAIAVAGLIEGDDGQRALGSPGR